MWFSVDVGNFPVKENQVNAEGLGRVTFVFRKGGGVES